MIPWSAYAPRRAKDPIAWLVSKGVASRADLAAALSELGIDPGSFPEAVICQHLEGLRSIPDVGPMEGMADTAEVQPASNDEAPAQVGKTKRKGWGNRAPT